MGGNCCRCSDCYSVEDEDVSLKLGLKRAIQRFSSLALYNAELTFLEKTRLTLSRLSDFKYKEKLGHGRFGVVYRVIDRRSQRSLAIKEVPKMSEIYSMEPTLEKEHVVMSKLNSPWLVDMYQCYESRGRLYMLLQFLPGPTLVQLVNSKKSVSHLTAKFYMAQMLSAMNAVHHHGYIHRDIKLANFILNHIGVVKLCDFGSCIRFLPVDVACKAFPLLEYDLVGAPPDHVLGARATVIGQLQFQPTVPHGTSYYCAPEVIQLATWSRSSPATAYSYLCDFWSLGVCFYYLIFKKLPFYSDEKIQVPSLILHWEKTLKFPKLAEGLEDDAADLIRGLLRPESCRLGKGGLHELTLHPFFAGIVWSKLGVVNPLLESGKSNSINIKLVSAPTIKRESILSEYQSWFMNQGSRLSAGLFPKLHLDADQRSYRTGVSFDLGQFVPDTSCELYASISQALVVLDEYNHENNKAAPNTAFQQ